MIAPETPGGMLVLTEPLPPLPVPAWKNPVVLGSVAGTLAVIVLLIVGILWILKRTARPPSPAESALAALSRAEGAAAITRILRDYLAAVVPVFHTGLTCEEIGVLAAHGATLPADNWLPLLRESDEAKFAGAGAPASLRDRAVELVRTSQQHLAARSAAARESR